MLSTGIRAQLGVKILGDDLDTLQRLTSEVERVIREVRGAAVFRLCACRESPISRSTSIAKPPGATA